MFGNRSYSGNGTYSSHEGVSDIRYGLWTGTERTILPRKGILVRSPDAIGRIERRSQDQMDPDI